MSRIAWIAALVVAGALVAGLLAAAFVVVAGSGDESAGDEVTIDFQQAAPRRLELPLAADSRALTVAQRKGRMLAGLAVDPAERIQVAVVEGEQPVPQSDLMFTVDGRRVTPTSCGRACWELDVQRPRELIVDGPETVRFALPTELPPSGAAAYAALTRSMNGLKTYRYDEQLTAGVGGGLDSTIEAQAPDRMRFRTTRGSRAIIVGESRWDFRNGRWERTPFPGLQLPSYMWDGARNARLVGRSGNRRVVSVFDREPVPAWFRLTVDAQNRVLEAEMLSPSHFMHQRFRDFDAPFTIAPPE
jgi:hypothetical protein